MPIALIDYAHNVYSQCGEDGVIAEICRRLAIRTGRFVDLGAWDGRHLSNTWRLLEQGWEGVFIEAEPDRHATLERNIAPFGPRAKAVCARVEPSGDRSLDAVLRNVGMAASFDLLSIDIDSYDWEVWHSLRDGQPVIVVIEGNTKIPPGIWQVHRPGITQGASFSALLSLGHAKGYDLVCHTGNLIFVERSRVSDLDLDPVALEHPETLFHWQRHRQELIHNRLSRRLQRLAYQCREAAAQWKRRRQRTGE